MKETPAKLESYHRFALWAHELLTYKLISLSDTKLYDCKPYLCFFILQKLLKIQLHSGIFHFRVNLKQRKILVS